MKDVDEYKSQNILQRKVFRSLFLNWSISCWKYIQVHVPQSSDNSKMCDQIQRRFQKYGLFFDETQNHSFVGTFTSMWPRNWTVPPSSSQEAYRPRRCKSNCGPVKGGGGVASAVLSWQYPCPVWELPQTGPGANPPRQDRTGPGGTPLVDRQTNCKHYLPFDSTYASGKKCQR